jgi:hypothetical protein
VRDPKVDHNPKLNRGMGRPKKRQERSELDAARWKRHRDTLAKFANERVDRKFRAQTPVFTPE